MDNQVGKRRTVHCMIPCITLDRALGLHNLEIARHQCAISRSHGTGVQSWDSTISFACTIEPFEFPSYIKVRDVRNKLLQLSRHLQCTEVWRQRWLVAVRCSVTEKKSDMLNDKAIAQRTNSGGMIMCEYLQVPCSTTARVRDGDGRDKWWVMRLNCTIYTKYREGIMSRTTANDRSWTLIHFAQATCLQWLCIFTSIYQHAVVPEVALPSTEDYLCCNIALYFISLKHCSSGIKYNGSSNFYEWPCKMQFS